MAEYRFDPVTHLAPWTREFHEHRERAPHLEQAEHQARLYAAAAFLLLDGEKESLSDLGAGDGGLLSLVGPAFLEAWGYDFQPANILGAAERGVQVLEVDVFGAGQGEAVVGRTVAMTEVLEHLDDPHHALRWTRNRSEVLVCSSPRFETPQAHSELHTWGWDMPGYAQLLAGAGWTVRRHVAVGPFQVASAVAV